MAAKGGRCQVLSDGCPQEPRPGGGSDGASTFPAPALQIWFSCEDPSGAGVCSLENAASQLRGRPRPLPASAKVHAKAGWSELLAKSSGGWKKRRHPRMALRQGSGVYPQAIETVRRCLSTEQGLHILRRPS